MFNSMQIFITMRCSGNCPYCIQQGIKRSSYQEVEVDKWIGFVSNQPKDSKVGLIGGEPMIYKGIDKLIEACHDKVVFTVTTNLKAPIYKDFGKFLEWARNYRVRWNLSFHPSVVSVNYFIEAATNMRLAGLWVDQVAAVHSEEIEQYMPALCRANIGFHVQVPTLIDDDGILHPTKEEFDKFGAGETLIRNHALYEKYCGGKKNITGICHTGKLLIAPNGDVYRCHRDIYKAENPIGNVFGSDLVPNLVCPNVGECNPCDFNDVRFWEL